VNISTTSTCGNLRLRFETRPGDETTLSVSGSTTINSSTAGGRWSDGTKTAIVEHLANGQWSAFDPPAQLQFATAQAPCQFVSGSVSEPFYVTAQSSSSANSRSVFGGPYPVTVTTTPGCTGTLRVSFSAGGSTVTVPLSSGNGTDWSGSITSSTGTNSWSVGSKQVRVQRCTGSSCTDLQPLSGSSHFTFDATASCSASGSVPQVRLSREVILIFIVRYSVTGGPYSMTVSADGPGCGGQFRAQIATGNSTVSVPLSGSAPTLTGQIANNLAEDQWQPGTRTVTVQQCTASSCGSTSSNWRDVGSFTFQAVYP